MIATHNIKVNGRWYKAGEEYPTPELDELKAEAKKLEELEVPEIELPAEEKKPAAEEPVQVQKPRTSARRKMTTSK